MPTTSTPGWSAAQNGVIGQAASLAASAQLDQMLGAHADSIVYQGVPIVTGSGVNGQSSPLWVSQLSTDDLDQPFTMSGTTVGRAAIPVLAVGSGADLTVSLCADNGSGSPGTVVCQTRIPASWINQLSAVSALSTPSGGTSVSLQYTGNPLAAGQYHTYVPAPLAGPTGLAFPSVTGIGTSASPSMSYYGGYIIQIGGVNNSLALNNVFTLPCSGGSIGQAIPQQAFPALNDGSSSTCTVLDAVSGSPVVVNTGGGTSYLGSPVATVYTSQITTSTGALSSWSGQTALPYSVQSHASVGYNGYVYVIGGHNSGGDLASVSYAQVQNQQITAWSAATPLPQPTQLATALVSNGMLYVIGGATSGLSAFSNVWYAPVNADGSLGQWQTGPSLPSAAYNLNQTAFASAYGLIYPCSAIEAALGTGVNGPAPTWSAPGGNGTAGTYTAFEDLGNGLVNDYDFFPSETIPIYIVTQWNLVPYLSVPLPASALTSGATYHLMLQQHGGSAANYLRLPLMATTGTNQALSSSASAYSWSVISDNAFPVYVYNNASQTWPPLHTWEDSGARVTTLVWATTPDRRLLGLCEATRTNAARNSNTGFETGTSPWVATNCTLTQSTAESYAGLHSGRVVPNGTSSSGYISSELLKCLPGQSVTVSGWFWLTSAVTAEFSLSVEWFTSTTAGSTSISTSSALVSIPAGTWTYVTNTFTAPSTPSLAYQYQVQPTLSGTPSSAQVWYADDVMGTDPATPQESAVTEVAWSGPWPNAAWTNPYNAWPPLGTAELA